MKARPEAGQVATPPRSGARRIAVLFHEGDRRRDPREYIVHHLAEFWREDGHAVSYLYGTRHAPPADIILVHVNLSVVPPGYIEFASRYPIVLNGRIRDIRRSTISRNLVRPGDPWNGPVIVKSDLNYAGVPERYMRMTPLEHRWRALRRVRRLVDRIRGDIPPFAGPRDYRIFDRIADVPAQWFSNQRVVVEKFRPEFENGLYHTRVDRSPRNW